MSEEFDTEYTRFLVCPYCGYEDHDAYEMFDRNEDTDTECGSCGKKFRAHQHIEITYSSEKSE